LLGGQADAQRQVELRFAGDGVVHQVSEQAFVAGLAIDEALAKAKLKIAILTTPAQQMRIQLKLPPSRLHFGMMIGMIMAS